MRRRQQPRTMAARPLLPHRRSTSAEVAEEGARDPPHGLRDKQSPRNAIGHLIICQASTSEAPRLKAAERRGCCRPRHNWQPLHGSAQPCRARLEQQLRPPGWRVLAGTGTLPLTRRRLTAREGGAWFSLAADQASCTRRTSGLSKELHPEAVHFVATRLCGTSRPAAGARPLAAPPAADCAACMPRLSQRAHCACTCSDLTDRLTAHAQRRAAVGAVAL